MSRLNHFYNSIPNWKEIRATPTEHFSLHYMTKKRELVTEEEVAKLIKHLSDNNKSNHEPLLKLLQEMQIVLDDSEFDDSIDGTSIRVTYTTEISRKGTMGKQGENVVRFQYIKETPIDYSKVPISFTGSSLAASDSGKTAHDTDSGNPIISYDMLNEVIPSLHEVLGLLKKVYFMPEDFSNRLAVERIHKLRDMFSKDEILAIPSISLANRAGLIPI
jgi:hypothetical protein